VGCGSCGITAKISLGFRIILAGGVRYTGFCLLLLIGRIIGLSRVFLCLQVTFMGFSFFLSSLSYELPNSY
jgi:hypothetical protein